jgi:choline dehydrogenase-like flavoprotein
VLAQAVASKILIDPETGSVRGVEYQRYDDPASLSYTVQAAKGRAYVLAAHAVENAKLMLASWLGGEGSLLGRNLMDHPALYVWGTAPVPVGPFRGPLSTAGIEDLRGGKFRSRHAAFRFDVGNDGWRATTGAPDSTVKDAVMIRRLFGKQLRAQLSDQLGRQVRFSVAVEQLPDLGNSVSVDPRHLDSFGNPRPVVSYRVGEYTLKGMAAASKVCQQIFRRAGIDDHTNYDGGPFFPSVEYQGAVFHYHGMGHFAGTHVMGDDPAMSVVDRDQRSWAHRNLFLVGSGSFPTMGTSNPTLTLAALAIRTADRMAAELAA